MQFLAIQSLFSWDNFTVTSPITNNMAGRSYDFNLVINTKAKSLNYGFIQTCVIRQISSYYYIIWVSGCCSRLLVLLNGIKVPQKSISMTLLAIQYVFNTYRNTESPYRNMVLLGDTHPYHIYIPVWLDDSWK